MRVQRPNQCFSIDLGILLACAFTPLLTSAALGQTYALSGQPVSVELLAPSDEIADTSVQDDLLLSQLTSKASLPSRDAVLRNQPALLPVNVREEYLSRRTELDLELSEIADDELRMVAAASHALVLEKWIASTLPPPQLKVLDELRVKLAFSQHGVFALEDERALEILGVSNAERRQLLSQRIGEVRRRLVRSFAESCVDKQNDVLTKHFSSAALAELGKFMGRK